MADDDIQEHPATQVVSYTLQKTANGSCAVFGAILIHNFKSLEEIIIGGVLLMTSAIIEYLMWLEGSRANRELAALGSRKLAEIIGRAMAYYDKEKN